MFNVGTKDRLLNPYTKLLLLLLLRTFLANFLVVAIFIVVLGVVCDISSLCCGLVRVSGDAVTDSVGLLLVNLVGRYDVVALGMLSSTPTLLLLLLSLFVLILCP